MKLLLLTFLLLLTPHEEFKWVAELMAQRAAWDQSIDLGLTTHKTVDFNGRKITYYTHNKKDLNGHLLTIVYDTIGFSSYKVEGLYLNDKLRFCGISFIDTLTNNRPNDQKYKWTMTEYYFTEEKNGVVDKYEIAINDLLPTRADSITFNLSDKTRDNISASTYNKLLTQLETDRRRITE